MGGYTASPYPARWPGEAAPPRGPLQPRVVTMPTETRLATKIQALRLTPHEDAAVRAAAAARGMGPSSFARAATLAAAGQPVPRAPSPARKPEAVAVARLHGELGRIGSLMNQLARAANSGGRVDAVALEAVRREWAAVRDLILDEVAPA